MSKITILPKETVDLIAAGEVAERPSAVVKELIENSIDAGANSIAVEIKDGGLKLIRISDDGSGMDRESLPLAFTAHATSKISKIEDLDSLNTFGFRGEALASISAVSKCEVITKMENNLTGLRYIYEGSREISLDEVGAPNGTTFIVRDMFYNTPARLKFLKSPSTEGGYVTEVVENAALSHAEIAFSFISNGRNILNTLGKNDLSECIYKIYGKDAYKALNECDNTDRGISVHGYFAKPYFYKANRNYEKIFVNNRPIKSKIITKAVEDAYSSYLMNHQFPFAVLFIDIDPSLVDVNVHPSKAEVRFDDDNLIYDVVYKTLFEGLRKREMLPQISYDKFKVEQANISIKDTENSDNLDTDNNISASDLTNDEEINKSDTQTVFSEQENNNDSKLRYAQPFETNRIVRENSSYEEEIQIINPKQLDLFEEKIIDKRVSDDYLIIGQLFDTYWIVQYKEKFLIIDQHAAHEKVLFEKYYKQISEEDVISQICSPSIIVSLSGREEEILEENFEAFKKLGFEIEHFGGRDYAIVSIPQTLNSINDASLFLEILSDMEINKGKKITETVYDRIATMACKAAVKGNMHLSQIEAKALIEQLLTLENPYHCPHGRPTIITMTKDELEKRFKRIV